MVKTVKVGRRSDSADEILQTAASLFVRHGYHGTSLAAIGDRLGITAAAIYYHFRSKEDLLFRYLDGAMRELLAKSKAALVDTSSPREGLETFTYTYVAFNLGLIERLAPASSVTYGISQLIDGLSVPNARKMTKLLWEYIESLRAIIAEGVEQGAFSTPDVTASAFAIIGMVEHAGLWFRSGAALGVDEIASLYASHAVNMLAIRDGSTGSLAAATLPAVN